MVINFGIPAKFPGSYILKIVLIDLNRTNYNRVIRFFRIVKLNYTSAQNFLALDDENDPVFGTSINQDQYFRIRYNHSDTGTLYIRYYNRKTQLAKAPFANDKELSFNFNPDSIFSVKDEWGAITTFKTPVSWNLSFPDGFFQNRRLDALSFR